MEQQDLKLTRERAAREEEDAGLGSLEVSAASSDASSDCGDISRSESPLSSLELPSGEIVEREDGNITYLNNFHRARLHESNIIVEAGILDRLAETGREVIPERSWNSNNYLVTDAIVDELYSDKVLSGLHAAGLKVFKIVIPSDDMDGTGESSTERHKTLSTFSSVVDQILERGIDKHSCIISLGGGVVSNICGFIASCLYRGIVLVHISTTMM